MNSGQEDEPEPGVLVCSRLLACGNIRYDPTDPDAGWNLERVLVHMRPAGPTGGGLGMPEAHQPGGPPSPDLRGEGPELRRALPATPRVEP